MTPAGGHRTSGERNRLAPEDRPVHDWYRFVLSFPPHLVRDYLHWFGIGGGRLVLDPFCGTGTVVVECKKLGIPSVGLEANPMAHFAGRVKVDWSPDPDGLIAHARRLAAHPPVLAAEGQGEGPITLRRLSFELERLLPAGSISPLPLHRALTLRGAIEAHRDERYHDHELLALARTAVQSAGNLRFGPEVGAGPPKPDAPVVAAWLEAVEAMSADLRDLRSSGGAPARVVLADARRAGEVLEPRSIDAVITSPPYPNEKDYTRATRLESVLLGFVRTRAELQSLKRGLLRSNTRGVYAADDEERWVAGPPAIDQIATEIETRRAALGKTSGFERLYARVTRLYFGGMARHLAGLRPALRPGARLAYVVGDQASYLRVMIRTGTLLADIARSLGYEVEGIDLFRTRLATATREQLREEVVLLRWPGQP
jgi:hypothetical protein